MNVLKGIERIGIWGSKLGIKGCWRRRKGKSSGSAQGLFISDADPAENQTIRKYPLEPSKWKRLHASPLAFRLSWMDQEAAGDHSQGQSAEQDRTGSAWTIRCGVGCFVVWVLLSGISERCSPANVAGERSTAPGAWEQHEVIELQDLAEQWF